MWVIHNKGRHLKSHNDTNVKHPLNFKLHCGQISNKSAQSTTPEAEACLPYNEIVPQHP